MSTILNVTGLTKNYGRFEALRGIDFEVKEREIFALIGPNGAGKTTALRIVATILQPTSGTVNITGYDIRKDVAKVRKIISYLPEEAGAYKNMTGEQYLRFMAEILTEDKDEYKRSIDTAMKIADLGKRISDKIGTYSKGMTRKVLLARAMMTMPTLAIMDEPTGGLDVLNALEIRSTIKKFTQQGMSVLLSSHNMLEIEYLSDRVAIIDKGKIYETGTPEELKRKYNAVNLEEVFKQVVQ